MKQTSDQNEGSEGSIAPALRLDFDDGSLDRMILLSTNDCLYCRGNPAAPNDLIIPHGTRQEADLFARKTGSGIEPGPRFDRKSASSQVKSSCYSPNFIEQTAHCDHKPRAALVFVRLLLHRRSAAGWAECTVARPGRVRRHAAQFSEGSSTPLIGHARVALSGVLTRLPSTQTDDTQRGGKSHELLPAP